MKDFSNYKFRASQSYKLMAGTIGLTLAEQSTLKECVNRKMNHNLCELDEKGKPVKPLSANMEIKLQELLAKQKNRELPKTMKNELRKIYRMEKYNRNFQFTNKFVVKGLQQEEEAITLLQEYYNAIGRRTFFTKNETRLFNDFFSGTPDLSDSNDVSKCKEGFDVKCSWSLESFPFSEDELDAIYEAQNQVYMNLSGADKWTTCYTLVNCTEHQLFNEKQKHFYALQMPADASDKYWDEYIERCRDVEKMLIFDYNRFVERYNPVLEISKDEWFGEGYDIPLEERVIEKVSFRNDDFIKELKERVKIGREYLNQLK